MHTTIAYSETVGVNAGWDNINAVPDQHIRTNNEFIYISDFNKIIGAVGYASTSDMIRLGSPSIRRINPYHITGSELDVDPAGDLNAMFHPDALVTLDIGEALECEIYNNPGAVVESVVVFLASNPIAPVSGNIFTIRFTTDVTLVASAWAFGEIDLPDGLPVGVYDIVGARLECAAGIAFRFVPVGGFHRPGGACVPTEAYQEDRMQRFGRIGTWCTFNTVQLPGVEVLEVAGAGLTTLTGYIDLIKKG